ncbi:hypothetical protein NECAME_02402 [Necator americanus]|uniref:Uncharacterized protein n=1 Tax=Necator americanus TaxID=51031 RepID=W2TE05_NECAM|nr:hypothetical protein NECAME_02402 [Necator americanus]ETN80270.1 hypothetical protein NECAME_02402 [Necator americanus]
MMSSLAMFILMTASCPQELTQNTSNDRGRSRKLVRLLIAAFFVATIILIVVSITLLLTQEPVNLNGSAAPTSSDGNETTSRLQFRRRPNYRKFTFEDLFSGKVFLKDSYTTGWTRNGGLIQTKDEYLGVRF